MMTDFDLDSPVGRRMVQAANSVLREWVDDGGDPPDVREMIAAALHVAMDDTCPTCEGGGNISRMGLDHHWQLVACFDCKDGKVRPKLMDSGQVFTRSEMEESLTREQDRVLAQVITKIVEQLKEAFGRTVEGDYGDGFQAGYFYAIEFVERRERYLYKGGDAGDGQHD